VSKIRLLDQLKLRVTALEALLDEGVILPGAAPPPTSMEQIRTWSVPEMGIEPIGSKASMNARKKSNEVAELLGELVVLKDRCKALRTAKTRSPKPKLHDQLEKLEKKNAAATVRIDILANELHEVRHELDTVNESYATQRLQLQEANALIITLRRQINSLSKNPSGRPTLIVASDNDKDEALPPNS
jgi:DNA repair exonuclease SbcCD ATPase subunit